MSVCPRYNLDAVAERGIFVYSEGPSDAVMANEVFRSVWAPIITSKLGLHDLPQVPLARNSSNFLNDLSWQSGWWTIRFLSGMKKGNSHKQGRTVN